MRRRDSRNTPTSHRCRECVGTGAQDIHVGNPSRETYVACEACHGTGWVTWRDADPLVRMKFLRELEPHRCSAILYLYADTRTRATQRAPLPRDRAPNLLRNAA